jgi:hypothetical protein
MVFMRFVLSSIFGLNIFISIGSIISSIIWISYNDAYIITSQFGLYICVAFISLLLSLLYLILRYNCHKSEQVLNNMACLVSFFLTILWMVASICITLLTSNCFKIRLQNDKNICTGAIFNIVSGFIELCLWISILWITIKRLLERYKREPALEAQASNEISRNEI